MNPVFDELAKCLICRKDEWSDLASVNHMGIKFKLRLCNSCGFVAQNPPLSKMFLDNYYEDNYVVKNYKNNISSIHQMFEPAKARITFLKENKCLSKLHRVLEIGPGAGTMMKLFYDEGIDISGIEPDPKAAKWIEEDLNLPIFKGFFDLVYDEEKVNWKKRLFDGILFTHVLEHISNPMGFFLKLKTIMKEDAILIIEVPNIERPFSDDYKWESYCDPGHLHYFSKNTLKSLLVQSGFIVELISDTVFEPYGNLFCIAKKQNKQIALEHQIIYNNDPIEIKNIWNNYVRYHRWNWIKYKTSRLLKRISIN